MARANLWYGCKKTPIASFRFLRNPDLKLAMDAVVVRHPGTVAMIDGAICRRSWWLIFDEDTVIIEGTPLIAPEVMDAPDAPR